MKIAFCLPFFNTHAQGGYKVVYEFANRLVSTGNDVSIYYDGTGRLSKYHVPYFVKEQFLSLQACHHPKWFSLSNKVRRHVVYGLTANKIDNYDVIFATGVSTAHPVACLPEEKGRKFYLIQDFEDWKLPRDKVLETYRLGMTNIVVSKWLKRIVDSACENTNAVYLPNAIDTNSFRVVKPIEKRDPLCVGLLYHKSKHKGVQDALDALKIIKKKYPQLKVKMFGATPLEPNVPNWINYTFNANVRQLLDIYNECSIFVCASINEGFGLTGAESMACGCALASTDYKGVHEYAIDKENALLSPIGDPESLARNIEHLIEDSHLRIKLAYRAVTSIQERSWDSVFNKFCDCLEATADGV